MDKIIWKMLKLSIYKTSHQGQLTCAYKKLLQTNIQKVKKKNWSNDKDNLGEGRQTIDNKYWTFLIEEH